MELVLSAEFANEVGDGPRLIADALARGKAALTAANAEALANADALLEAGLYVVVTKGAGLCPTTDAPLGVRLTVQGYLDRDEAESVAGGVCDGSGGDLSAYVLPRMIK